MLQYSVVETTTLELLKRLQSLPELSGMRLAGGTALALQIGHRKSIDLDFFGELKADYLSLSNSFHNLGSVQLLNRSANIFIFLLDDIKVDIENYPYEWLESPLIIDGLLLANQKDIAAMKMAAITGRGTKKDFYDIYFLLKQFSLKDMLSFYRKKYYDGSEFMVVKSLTYFTDAEQGEAPMMLLPVTWEEVKMSITEAINEYIKGN